MNDKRVFRLYSSCKLVRGASRSIICDIQRGQFLFVSNEQYKFLLEKPEIGEENKHATFIDMLVHTGMGFWTKEPMNFPEINWEYEVPSKITNAIVDFDGTFSQPLEKIVGELDDLGCQAIQIRTFSPYLISEISDFMNVFEETRFQTIELLLKYHESYLKTNVIDLCKRFRRIRRLDIHSAPENIEITKADLGDFFLSVNYHSGVLYSENNCGVVHPDFFITNTFFFSESQLFNTCLNKKVSIDKTGEIKNCPSMKVGFGRIIDVSLIEVIIQDRFKKYWLINKDQVEVCKDCEFRYMCTDCRAYVNDKQNPFSKPSKCNYNPYKGIWE